MLTLETILTLKPKPNPPTKQTNKQKSSNIFTFLAQLKTCMVSPAYYF